MAQVKDAIGNALEEGDLVQVSLPTNVMLGHVKKIQEGGLSLVRGRSSHSTAPESITTPGQVSIEFTFDAGVHPQFGITAGVVKVVDPDKATKKK